MTPEKKVQNDIVNYLNTLKEKGYPVYVERRQAGGFSYKKGIPDLYAVYYGLHIEIEVKKVGGELSTMQEKFRDMCYKNNIKYICADNIDSFIDFMNEIKLKFISRKEENNILI